MFLINVNFLSRKHKNKGNTYILFLSKNLRKFSPVKYTQTNESACLELYQFDFK